MYIILLFFNYYKPLAPAPSLGAFGDQNGGSSPYSAHYGEGCSTLQVKEKGSMSNAQWISQNGEHLSFRTINLDTLN